MAIVFIFYSHGVTVQMHAPHAHLKTNSMLFCKHKPE